MDLPLPVSVAPMLARLSRELPDGGHLYEPICAAFTSGPFARYFSEDAAGALRHVGAASSFTDAQRLQLFLDLVCGWSAWRATTGSLPAPRALSALAAGP
ncbi:MAG TPA: hypothetical protein VF134_02655 [Candidatus Dormibacteraeota bacterium]